MSSTIVICDPSPLAEELARALVSRGDRVEWCTEGYRAAELAGRTRADLVIVGARAPGPSLARLLDRVGTTGTSPPTVVLTDDDDADQAAHALAEGARGVIERSSGISFLLWAIDRINAGGVILSPRVTRAMAEQFAEALRREREWSRVLAQITRRSQEIADVKAEFVTNVSHELRTPLTIIKGLAAALATRMPPEEAGLLEKIDSATDRLNEMVGDLIRLAEVYRGDVELEVRACDLSPVLRDSVAEVASGFPAVPVALSVPESLPASADPDRMRDVIRHLVENACRYSDPGDPVTVGARTGEEGITVTVTDRGRGLQRPLVETVFAEPFTTGEGTLTKERSGLGIGIHLARTLVMLHGGILWADPLPGGGSKVSFTLPPVATSAQTQSVTRSAGRE